MGFGMDTQHPNSMGFRACSGMNPKLKVGVWVWVGGCIGVGGWVDGRVGSIVRTRVVVGGDPVVVVFVVVVASCGRRL